MKKSNLFFIYGLLFAIISNVTDSKLIIGLSAIFAILYVITSLILAYFENKYK